MLFLNTILDIIFPVKCLSCGYAGVDLCLVCTSNFPQAERENAKWIFSFFDYRHPPLKKALWLLKYKGKKRLANIFAELMYGKILEELSDLAIMQNFRESLLIPIPLSPKRYRERGYNQAELICEKLVELDRNINFKLEKNVLIKNKETKHQAHIKNRSERLKNLIGSFTIKSSKQNAKENISIIKGRNIILIDDITTTGATLNEAKKTLKQAGARKIIAFTVAH
ncbi:hypothetical protein A2W67_02420 [Candidatus Nomurabacteria bacterium RIFCSPLOWO2_02_40_28]|uniref:Phosphoribosyltransferase domain-containing protein n=2 Tax=Candidatus Nomuraibacteriota TaxID=1752729 RepID=A0A837HTY5_9BACT|nr:MAG: hypothetical protein UT27_C0008G0004 [Candidatus Nomurabacteria bacterium GW2011_GWD2_39_12]KKR20501.1 MAG: hypothetical protein UT51_C0003G0005 [Candidatus Nomurabacteria bacterium GW2011_GWC2_39_41]KKR36297.1 MAG: hypothetical protein UT70_C0017G0009 [Candidatus Nomurabacteria bacterium GW2011_GWE2_40_10]KKR38473.1 MAG: hypothetical protein UT73_C0003G0113 [Candidatus Nomurabacteria bacterium GW2011_GWB1_40_11]KKR39581.1 MAG: hypothetical protein UT74_C0009G0019 [Parcubacteria group b